MVQFKKTTIMNLYKETEELCKSRIFLIVICTYIAASVTIVCNKYKVDVCFRKALATDIKTKQQFQVFRVS